MKFVIVDEIGSVAFVRDGHVVYVPLGADNTFDTEESPVEHEPDMDAEPVTIGGMTLGDVERETKAKLGLAHGCGP